jgi:endoglucanase
VDLYVVFSAGEEFSGFGARHAAWAIEPDEAIVIDVTHGVSANTPKDKAFALGSGAIVGIAPILNGGMTDKLLDLAERCKLPFAKEAMGGRTGTNSDCVATSRNGVPTALVSIPLRYMHSGCEVVDLADMKACAQLIGRYIHQGGLNRYE